MEGHLTNFDRSCVSEETLKNLRQQCIKSILHFLKGEMLGESLDSEQKESIAIAKQCLEVCYEMDSETLSNPVDLLALCHSMNEGEQVLAEEMELEAERNKVQGNDCMRDGDFNAAIDFYSRAIKINSKKAIYYCNRAAALSRLNRHKDAISDCKEAIKLDPNYGKAYGRLGIAYSHLMMYQEAADAYRTALQLDPNNASYEANLKLAEEKIAPAGSQQIPGGMNFDFTGFMNNPALLNMATQMLNDPTFRNMVSGIMTSGPSGDPNLDSFVEVGQQLAEHMHQSNPDVLEQLRHSFEARGGGSPGDGQQGPSGDAPEAPQQSNGQDDKPKTDSEKPPSSKGDE